MLVAALLVFSCVDYQVESTTGPVDAPRAELALEPATLVFEGVTYGDEASGEIVLSSVGDARLRVEDIALLESEAFTWSGPELPVDLEPGESVAVDVRFHALSSGEEGRLVVTSDDATATEREALLLGEVLFPELQLTPSRYDFGNTNDACSARTQGFTLQNVGEAPLEVTGMIVTGTGFTLPGPPALPFVLEPDERTEVEVAFSPLVEEEVEGLLRLASTDPGGDRSATLAGGWEDLVTDAFEQGQLYDGVDVIITIDHSCSMDDDIRRVADNMPGLLDALDTSWGDWQLAVVTADDGCRNGALFDSSSPPSDAEIEASAWGPYGSWTEAGFTLGLAAMEASDGGCNDGLVRDDAFTHLICISDEPEQSARTWSNMVGELQAIDASVVVSAVVGDYPSGCSTAAAGTGYYQAVGATGGAFVSICDADWSSVFDGLAGVDPFKDTFVLSERPAEGTIAVAVDGAVQTDDWSYDTSSNAVVFETDALPAPGSTIVVQYAVCDG